MTPGTKIQYKDISGVVTAAPRSCRDDNGTIWVLTQDGFLVGVPCNSPKLQVLDSLPPLNPEDVSEAVKAGYISKTPKESPAKLYLRTGFIKLPATRFHPSGLFKIVAGGLGVDRQQACQNIPGDCRCILVDWQHGEGYFLIKIGNT